MRTYFELGGRGEILLSELSTSPQKGYSIGFEGYYIRVTRLPEYSQELFRDEEAYRVIKAHINQVQLYYTWGQFFSGVNVPGASELSVNFSNRLGQKQSSPFIGISTRTDAAIFLHEKTHHDDDRGGNLEKLAKHLSKLIVSGKLPNQAFRIIYLAVYEKRAYATDIKYVSKGLGKSKQQDDEILERITNRRAEYFTQYFDALLKLLQQVSQTDPNLANELKAMINELCEGTDMAGPALLF